MARLVVGITAVVVLLIALKVVPLLLGVVLIVAGLLVSVAIGERLDRGRRSLTHNPAAHFDANRGDFHGSSSHHTWQSPQPLHRSPRWPRHPARHGSLTAER